MKKHITLVVAFLCIAFAFGFLIIRDFSGPIAGGGDADVWEYMGFYFAKNLRFSPFPNLNLVNNQVFYPYGINSVFQAWALERDILYALFYSFFGNGSWLKFYYFGSVLITAIGAFALLVRDYGVVRASGVGLLSAFCNFYAINLYPSGYGMCILHWATLNFIADFLLVKRITLGQHISVNFWLLRACLLILALGEYLGYIAGYSLMSFTVSISFIIALIIYRAFKRKLKLVEITQNLLLTYKAEVFRSSFTFVSLITIFIIFSYIYLPLVIQIARESKSFDFTKVPSGAWWVSPFRLLIPYFPNFEKALPILGQIFGDVPETGGDGTAGWFLLILGSVGLYQSRKQIAIYIPLIIIFLLCLLYNPQEFPTLKIFPWFAFNRVGGRSTFIYPVILCLFALNINWDGIYLRRRQLISALLVGLACTELYTAYSPRISDLPYSFDQNFFSYMNYVKEQPGEAVLDWPFCAVGGNGVALDSLCPYYVQNSSIFSLRRFHEKKVMGQYFGRLLPSQIEPYLQAGLDKLFLPDNPVAFKATRPRRCFNLEEWSFFTDFYRLNDFAGINLYVDLLPESCVNEFYSRFGTPAMETKVPAAGTVKFIKKSPELRNQIDLTLGSSIKFQPSLDLSESNLLQSIQPSGLKVTGLSEIDEQPGRWGFGPESKLEFKLNKAQLLELWFQFNTPIPNQNVVIEINGNDIDEISKVQNGTSIERRLKFRGIKGFNTVRIKYKDWNHNKTTFAPKDERFFAVYFTKLIIEN